MRTMNKKLLTGIIGVTVASFCWGQGTAFTYQGRLNDAGNPAAGNYDFTFAVYGTNSGNSPITQTITNSSVSVGNGLFTTTLDFGNFLTGNLAWLEISVRSNGTGGFVTLIPRQQLTPTPYAMFANTASNLVGPINGSLIAAGTIGATQIAPGSVGTAQLTAAAASGILALQVPNTTNLQAVVNSSYVFTNSAANHLALPASPNIGDRVRVAGGAGTFSLVANTGQSILSPPSFFWTTLNAGSNAWVSVSMSGHGSNVVAGKWDGTNGAIFVSTDSGANWSSNNDAGSGPWVSVATSADGSRMAAVQLGGPAGFIYLSTNYGVNWSISNYAGWGGWGAVAMNADGSKLIAGQAFGFGLPYDYIYTSTNYGINWMKQIQAGSNSWGSVAINADGSTLLAGPRISPGFLVASTNGGASWSTNNDAGKGDWLTVAMNSDGSKMVAAQYPGYVSLSTNRGVNWSRQLALGSNYWQSVSISSNGSKMVAACVDAVGSSGGNIFGSFDSGITWAPLPNIGSNYWTSTAMSADGSRMIASQSKGSMYSIPNYITQWSTFSVRGSGYANIELVYVGNRLWVPSFYTGNFTIQ